MLYKLRKVILLLFVALLTPQHALSKLWLDLSASLLGSSLLYTTYKSNSRVHKQSNLVTRSTTTHSTWSYALGTGLCAYGLWKLGRNFYAPRKQRNAGPILPLSHALLEGEEHLSAMLEGTSQNYVPYNGNYEDVHNLLLANGRLPKTSTDHLVLLAEHYGDSKIDQDWVKQEEQKNLQVLEEEIMAYVDALPEDLKKMLGDWPAKFAKFKNILALVRTDVEEGSLKEDRARRKGSAWTDLILAALGLKPCTIEDTKSEQVDLLINLINKKYPEELISYECTANKEKQYALVNQHPLLPLDFVIACYKHDSVDLQVSEQIKSWMADFGKYYKELILNIWDEQNSTADEKALLLGLSPEIFDWVIQAFHHSQWYPILDFNTLLTDNAQAYGILFASGNTGVTLKRTHLDLYKMLLVYGFISIHESKKFLLYLGGKIKPKHGSPNDPALFEKVFGKNFSDVSEKGMLDRALYVLKQAQKQQV